MVGLKLLWRPFVDGVSLAYIAFEPTLGEGHMDTAQRFLIATGLLSTLFIFSPSLAYADPASVTAEVCNEAGLCAPVDPATALLIIGLAEVAKELSKDDPFGKNNEIVKAVKTMVNDLTHGTGPNNDLVKIFNNAGKDLRCGPGPSNDIVKFLGDLGIKIQTHSCD